MERCRCELALGFERMAHGALGTNPVFPDRLSPMCPLLVAAEHASPDSKRGPPMPRVFGAAATEYFRKKNHKHSVNNPYSHFWTGYDEAAVLAFPQISNELTKYVCSPTSDGAACCILQNEEFVHDNKLDNQAIECDRNRWLPDGSTSRRHDSRSSRREPRRCRSC
ncbi:hypothetical protein EI94DRAFT_1759186 [Lactarius quietus]|nr:hypothetical protein EI94DRAFT_1759186 [Lactarius quietus]